MKLRLFLVVCMSCVSVTFAAKVDTLMVVSSAMHKTIPNIVITPEGSDTPEDGFPVVYLLHGATGNYKDWVSVVPAIKDYADQYQLMIVCPDGGFTSWYFDSPVDPAM